MRVSAQENTSHGGALPRSTMTNRILLPFVIGAILAGAACMSSSAPQAPMAPTPTTSSSAILVAPPRVPDAAPTAGESVSCEHVVDETKIDESIEGAKQLCRSYRDEMMPATAREAIACMRDTGWSACSRSTCTLRALQAAPAVTDARCAKVERACSGMGELCDAHISGLNEIGKARFTKCLTTSCGIGLRFCLWDPSTTPCDARMP